MSDYILKESRRRGEGASEPNAPLTLREQKQEEFTLLLLLSLLPRFEERERETFVRRKDNLLPPIILEVEVELKGKKQ